MQQVLELDPDFHVALYHMFDVWQYNDNWQGVIDFIEEHGKKIPRKFQITLIRAYENINQSDKAKQYYENIERVLIETDPDGLCWLNAETAYNLSSEDALFNEAMYYSEKAVEICPLDSDFLNFAYSMNIAIAHELEGIEKSKDTFYKITKKLDPERKVEVLYGLVKTGAYALQEDVTKFNLSLEWFYPYIDLIVEISAKHGLTKQYTKAMFLTAFILSETPDKAAEAIRVSLSKHCPSGIKTDCFTLHEKSVELFYLLYKWGEYELADEIGQFLIDTIDMASAEDIFDEDEKQYFTEELSHLHYIRGLLKLKTGSFDDARLEFYNALSSISKDDPDDPPWIIKSKIAECYYKNSDYSNALKNYRKNYYDTSWEENWKYAELSMLALSEFKAGEIDSAKIHFNLVEKKYNDIDHDEDPIYYYTDWPLYQYYDANGNGKKALKYLNYAYDNIPEYERSEYLEDQKRMDHLYKYYYIHEIIEAYNQNIR